MIRNEFVFENGTAMIRDIETKEVLLLQPGMPGQNGLEPWASEETAEAWINLQFGYLFVDNDPEPIPEPPLEETPSEGSGE
jgi:hypothetical protein